MVSYLKDYLFGSVFRRGAALLTALTLASYGLGLVRDMLFARILGAGPVLDAYNAAFIIPDLLLNVFVAGALAAAFVPVFTALMAKERRADAERLAATMLAAAPVSMAVLGLVAAALMPWLAGIVAPGFGPAETALLVKMSRLLLLSPVIFAASNTLGGILVSLERFAAYGLAPVLYNLGIIAGALAVPTLGPMGLVMGTLAGALLHLAVRALAVRRLDIVLHGPVSLRDPEFRRVAKLMLPRMAGQPVEQLTFLIFTNLASALAVGSVAIVSFARNFMSVPVSVFGISVATAVFASLSRSAALDDDASFMRSLREAAKPLALATAASAAFYIILGKPLISLLLGGGRFGSAEVEATASLLAWFALAIPAEGFIHLLVRAFYALHDTWTPIFVSVPGLGVIWFLADTLTPSLGLNALGIAYAVAVTAEALMLLALLRRRLRRSGKVASPVIP